MRFYHEELDPVPVDAPLLHVNAESASAAISWAEEKGYIVSHDMEKDCPVISRRMDRHHDILYFPPGNVEELAQDIWDLNGIHPNYFGDWWMPTQYAISEVEMLSAEKDIASIFSCDDTTCCLKAPVAYVLTAETATLLPKAEFTGRIKAQRWGVQPGNETALEFDFTSRTFSWGPGDKLGSDALLQVMEDMYLPLEMDKRKYFYMKEVHARREV